jgi:hypothetical protein
MMDLEDPTGGSSTSARGEARRPLPPCSLFRQKARQWQLASRSSFTATLSYSFVQAKRLDLARIARGDTVPLQMTKRGSSTRRIPDWHCSREAYFFAQVARFRTNHLERWKDDVWRPIVSTRT